MISMLQFLRQIACHMTVDISLESLHLRFPEVESGGVEEGGEGAGGKHEFWGGVGGWVWGLWFVCAYICVCVCVCVCV